ncbi:hypothetical protein CK496_07255 [Enterococcus thailandicus]|nr:hypothetical protein CK496_07255 [Enterococcus thailandicus]
MVPSGQLRKNKEQLLKIDFHIFKQLRVIVRSCLGNTVNKVVVPSGQLRKNKEQLLKIDFHIFKQLRVIVRSCLGNTVNKVVVPNDQLQVIRKLF